MTGKMGPLFPKCPDEFQRMIDLVLYNPSLFTFHYRMRQALVYMQMQLYPNFDKSESWYSYTCTPCCSLQRYPSTSTFQCYVSVITMLNGLPYIALLPLTMHPGIWVEPVHTLCSYSSILMDMVVHSWISQCMIFSVHIPEY